ncbi:MAG: hypothetical protein QXG83_02670 [Candidatus Pacearchaeota archaeon]
MKKKKLEILVVEDQNKNLENCKRAYEPLAEEGLILPHYATNYKEAEPLIDKVDAGILDLYFPAENGEELIKEFARKYEIDSNFHEEVKANGMYPMGLIIADKLAEQGKPSIFVSTIASGHGSHNNPFYPLRYAIDGKKVPKAIKIAWSACENAYGFDGEYGSPAFVSYILGRLGSMIHGYYRDDIEKIPEVWSASAKAIAALLKREDIYNKIKVDELVEKNIERFYKMLVEKYQKK